jgi:hypothetical protein
MIQEKINPTICKYHMHYQPSELNQGKGIGGHGLTANSFMNMGGNNGGQYKSPITPEVMLAVMQVAQGMWPKLTRVQCCATVVGTMVIMSVIARIQRTLNWLHRY